VFLWQEVERLNALIELVDTSLHALLRCLQGLEVMSTDLANLVTAIRFGRVPEMWAKKAYPSEKPLGSWLLDLSKRADFLQQSDPRTSSADLVVGFLFPTRFFSPRYCISLHGSIVLRLTS